MTRPLLSAALIMRDEAHIAKRILKCVRQFADEIIVVDTGSTDNSVEVVESLSTPSCPVTVVHFKWIQDFSAARNYSFKHCTGEWIFWCDFDDVIQDTSIAAIRQLKKAFLEDPAFQDRRSVFCPYRYSYDNAGRLTSTLNRERFLRNGIGHVWEGRIHEVIADPWTDCAKTDDVIIEHRPPAKNIERKSTRNLDIFEAYIQADTCSLRELYLYSMEHLGHRHLHRAYELLSMYDTRSGDRWDKLGEKYLALVRLADCARQLGRAAEAGALAWRCVHAFPARAEAYCALGALALEADAPYSAWPLFVAASACATPPSEASLVATESYTMTPLRGMEACLKVFGDKGPVTQHTALNAELESLAKRLRL